MATIHFLGKNVSSGRHSDTKTIYLRLRTVSQTQIVILCRILRSEGGK